MPLMNGRLCCRADGSLRILFLSDFQETRDAFDPRTLRGVNSVLDAEQPDLVVLCGDNCNGPRIHGADELRAYLDMMMEPFVRRGIPWCHVNGNHDYDAEVPMDDQFSIYRAIPGCLTGTVPGLPGTTNFVLPVYSADGESLMAAVWGLDAGHSMDSIRPGLAGEAILPGMPNIVGGWDIIRFEQLMWYWNTSRELEARAGHAVPGVMALHVAPWEFEYMRQYPDSLGVKGNTEEPYNLGALNSGLFAALVQRGDVKCVCCGHTHMNTCSAKYCGISMCNVGAAGYSAYGKDALRGGRIVELNAVGDMTTRMAYFDDYVK